MANELWKEAVRESRRAEGDPWFHCPLSNAEQDRLGIAREDVLRFCKEGCFDKRGIGGRRDCKTQAVQMLGKKYGLTLQQQDGQRVITKKENSRSNVNSRG